MSALLATFAMLAAVTVPRTEKPVLVSLGCDGRTASVAEAEAVARGFAFQVQEDASQEALALLARTCNRSRPIPSWRQERSRQGDP